LTCLTAASSIVAMSRNIPGVGEGIFEPMFGSASEEAEAMLSSTEQAMREAQQDPEVYVEARWRELQNEAAEDEQRRERRADMLLVERFIDELPEAISLLRSRVASKIKVPFQMAAQAVGSIRSLGSIKHRVKQAARAFVEADVDISEAALVGTPAEGKFVIFDGPEGKSYTDRSDIKSPYVPKVGSRLVVDMGAYSYEATMVEDLGVGVSGLRLIRVSHPPGIDDCHKEVWLGAVRPVEEPN